MTMESRREIPSGACVSEAWVNGKAAPLREAVAAAAAMLRRARSPIVAGMGTDMAGTRAAILIAEKLGAAFDHMHAAQLFADLEVLRSNGAMLTTPNEVRLRADTVLLVGAKAAAYAGLPRLLAPAHPGLSQHAGPRRVICLGPVKTRAASGHDVQHVKASAAQLPAIVSALLCALRGKPFGPAPIPANKITALAAALQQAQFGAAIWSADEFADDAMLPFMLTDLVTALNNTTRFSALPLAPSSNGAGVVQTAAWMTGFPMRTSFARGYPEHDPWRFDSKRMAARGEADAALWLSAYEDTAPPWTGAAPLIALTGAATRFAKTPNVRITIGKPGRDHDGVELSSETSTFVPIPASAPSALPTAAHVLTLIDAAVSEGGRA
jgi:formylmethanofuran dehydrogenase subunit B